MNIPIDVRLQFAAAVRKVRGGFYTEEDIHILPQYWIRIEPWSDACLDFEPTVDLAFKSMMASYLENYGLVELKTVWAGNGETKYGSSITLFRKTR